MEAFLRMEKINKTFPGVHALQDVSFSVSAGEVHGLLGENGAGKSTLMKVLGGVYDKTDGNIYIQESEIPRITPKLSTALGIAFVHQEIILAETMSVAENVYLGRLPYKNALLGIVDYKALYRNTESILSMMNMDIAPKTLVGDLTTAKKQMVEIAKAISQNARIIIFDEPTTSLSAKDVDSLFAVINVLKEKGVAVIYISHRLTEIFQICERATVLRDGKLIGTVKVDDVDQATLIHMMVGRELNELYPKEPTEIGEIILEAEDLRDEANRVKGVSFNAKKGEVLGFSGLVGSGRTETMRLLFGADKTKTGIVKINGEISKIESPQDAVKNGICLLTEDRKLQGLALNLTVEENLTITSLNKLILNHKKMRQDTKKYIDSLKIKTPSGNTMALNLSGGNQQKIIIGKWLNTESKVFVFDEPTKGIDVGAKAEIYAMINNLAQQGYTIIVVSSELP